MFSLTNDQLLEVCVRATPRGTPSKPRRSVAGRSPFRVKRQPGKLSTSTDLQRLLGRLIET